jgi:hypothetical protein
MRPWPSTGPTRVSGRGGHYTLDTKRRDAVSWVAFPVIQAKE